MSEKLWREMELGFLNQLYIHKGADKISGYNDTVAYAVVMAIYNKIMELIGTDKVVVEAEKAQKLIESIMPKRHAMAVDFI